MFRRQLLTILLLGFCAGGVLAQERDARQVRMSAVERVLDKSGDESLRAFSAEHLAPAYIASFADEAALLTHLRGLRTAVGPIGGVGVEVDAAGRVRLHIKNRERATVVAFEVEDAAPHRITELVVESSTPRGPELVLTWETLERELESAAKRGFCGSILAVRDGRVVLDRGFGHADPGKEHAITPDTIFAIGSTPIDFTHGALLKLEELGLLSLSDTLERFFEGVPEDKVGITLEHLRTGRSGLIDFPAIDGVDENHDLSWIDRKEFMRRVFASKLEFEPGTEERHSHMAWGVLAAVIEVASKKGYEEFLREMFFAPAGMQRTGHYPITKCFPESEVAIGLGGQVWGKVNAPQHWGRTSWLVLGSGGMVSTPRDLRRWREFLLGEQGLGVAARRKYGVGGEFVGVGGNDRGFINTLGIRGDDLVIVCGNSHVAMDDDAARVALAAARVALTE